VNRYAALVDSRSRAWNEIRTGKTPEDRTAAHRCPSRTSTLTTRACRFGTIWRTERAAATASQSVKSREIGDFCFRHDPGQSQVAGSFYRQRPIVEQSDDYPTARCRIPRSQHHSATCRRSRETNSVYGCGPLRYALGRRNGRGGQHDPEDAAGYSNCEYSCWAARGRTASGIIGGSRRVVRSERLDCRCGFGHAKVAPTGMRFSLFSGLDLCHENIDHAAST